MSRSTILTLAACLGGVSAATAHAGTDYVRVRVENLAPSNGTYLTPMWVGFHDGTFDLYNTGEAASAELERLAEDGNFGPLSSAFGASGAGGSDGAIAPGGPFAPGSVAEMTLALDGSDASNRYFSYASMVIPSNDAFIANGNPMAHEIFDAGGNFVGGGAFTIAGSAVLDAGTEVNDEIPMNTAFFGQSSPDTGTDEGGTVGPHPGFMAQGSGGILDDPMFANADFTADGYQVARITITQVPTPGALALLGVAGVATRRRRRR